MDQTKDRRPEFNKSEDGDEKPEVGEVPLHETGYLDEACGGSEPEPVMNSEVSVVAEIPIQNLILSDVESSKVPERRVLQLLDLPVEIIENICGYLNIYSLQNLKITSVRTRRTLDKALASRKCWNYWKLLALSKFNKPILTKSLRSFDTLICVRRRRESQLIEDALPASPNMYCWKDVFISLRYLQQTLKLSSIEKKILYDVQERLKNEVREGFKEKAKLNYPSISTTTCGNLLIYNQVPCSRRRDLNHGYIFEDMQFYRRALRIVGRGERISYTKLMPLQLNNTRGKSLIQPTTLVLFVTNFRIVMFDSREGSRHIIPLPMPEYLSIYGSMPAMVAIRGKWLGIWVNPERYQLYTISVDTVTGTPNSELIKDIYLEDKMLEYWTLVRDAKNEYIAMFKGPPEPQGEGENQELLPVFVIMSPKNQCASITLRRTNYLGQALAYVNKLSPQYPTGKQKYPVSRSVQLIGQAQGHGLALFWSKKCLFVLCDVATQTFIYEDWPYDLLEETDDSWYVEQKPVEMLEIISRSLLMLYIGNHIVIATLKIRYPSGISEQDGRFEDRGAINVEPIRRIDLNNYLDSPTTRIQNFTFDFDRGTPYIFCTLDELGTQSPYTYQLMKLVFVDVKGKKQPKKLPPIHQSP